MDTHVSIMPNQSNVSAPSTAATTAREEGFLHYLAREGRIILHWTIGLCLIAVVVFMVTALWMFAAVPGLILVTAYVLLLAANEVERRSDTAAHAILEQHEHAGASDIEDDEAEANQLAPVPAAIVKRESRHGVVIVASVLVAALIIAFILLPWQVVAIGALVVFAYILLVAAPFWLGAIEDDIEIESSRLENRPPPASVRTQ